MSGTPQVTATKKCVKDSSVPPNFFTWQLSDPSMVERYLIGLSLANCTPTLEQDLYSPYDPNYDDPPVPETDDLKVSTVMSCSLCGIVFQSRHEQVHHYKADWHGYNLKQKLAGNLPVTEQHFLDMIDEVSSISGSESGTDMSDSAASGEVSKLREPRSSSLGKEASHGTTSTDTDGEDTDQESPEVRGSRLNPKVYLKNAQGQVLALYRCIVHGKLVVPNTCSQLMEAINKVPQRMQWAVLMLGGGHFAAAIFDGAEPLVHKTFHRYTVRAKQGGSQATKDSRGNKGMQPKSAGASLRRSNQLALLKEIQELLATWSEELSKCSTIFVRATGGNRVALFSGKNPALKKWDPRLRTIPFATNRATFKEVLRVHRILSTVECFGSESDLKGCIPVSPKIAVGTKKPEKESGVEDVVVSRLEEVAIQDDGGITSANLEPNVITGDLEQQDHGEDSDSTVNWDMSEETVDLGDLREFACTRKPRKRKIRKKRNPEKGPQGDKPMPREFVALQTALLEACKAGNTEALTWTLHYLDRGEGAEDPDATPVVERVPEEWECPSVEACCRLVRQLGLERPLLSGPIDSSGDSLLHYCARRSALKLLRCLMDSGADPAVKNGKGQTPYLVCPDKQTRNEFRRFRAAYPDKFDYEASQIPTALTVEMEQDQFYKQKEKRKLHREKLRERKAAQVQRKEEEEEKLRFLSLTDREKRALAAERRFATQLLATNSPHLVLTRCFMCGADMTGKVAFEYSENKFCTTDCVKEHRKKPMIRT